MKNKIYLLKNLQKKIQIEKKKGKKIILCHGVFDLLHIGHIKHLSKAKDLGDILVVSITPDKYVNKGPYQPFFSTQHRLKALSYIQSIDYVIESNTSDAMEMIRTIKPDYYCKGNDYKKHSKDLTGKIVSLFLEILNVSVFLKPQLKIFKDPLDLEVFVWNPLATAISLLSSLFIELAKEYFSTAK